MGILSWNDDDVRNDLKDAKKEIAILRASVEDLVVERNTLARYLVKAYDEYEAVVSVIRSQSKAKE